MSSLAWAQADAGGIQGSVKTESGQPIYQARVVLSQNAGELKKEATTDLQGNYQFLPSAKGVYRIEVSADDYIAQSREGIAWEQGSTVEVDFNLPLLQTTLREAEERGVRERNPNIFIRRVDLNALRDPLRRRGIDPVFLDYSVAEGNYGAEFDTPLRQILWVVPEPPSGGFHGSLYESHQNSALNARPFFNVGPLRPSKRNQFGFTGTMGPLLGHDLFISSILDFVRESGFVNGNVRVPLPSERTPTADDPVTNQVVAALLQAYPDEDPNLPDVAPRQLNTSAIRRRSGVDWTFRVDHRLSEKDDLGFRYTLSDFSEEPFELVAGKNPKTDLRSQSFSLTDIRTAAPSTVIRGSFYFDRLGALLLPTEGFSALLQPLGLADVPDIDFGGSQADLTGIGPGPQFPRKRFQNRFGGDLDFAYEVGRHRFRFGGRSLRVQLNDLQSDNGRGKFVFRADEGRTAVENFLSGRPTTFTITVGDLYRGFRNWEHALYIQDTYQASPALTLTAGLRYEIVTAPSEVNDRTQFSYGTDANNFAPQLGFAWVPGQGSTVIRGGYGISFGHIFAGTYQSARFNPPAVSTVSIQNPSLINPLGNLDLNQTEGQRSELNLLSEDLVSPYSHQYSLLVERRLSQNLLFQVGYVGNRTLKLFFPFVSNRAEPVPGMEATTDNIDDRRPDPRFLRIATMINSGIFYFDAMKVSLRRSFAAGFAFDLNYVLSKALSSTTDFAATNNREIGENPSQNNVDVHADLKGPSAFDHRHALIARYRYRLPIDRPDGLSAFMLNGWEVSGMTELRTGLAFTINTSSDAPGFGNVDGEGGDRVNITNPDILGTAFNDPDISTSILRPEFFNTEMEVGGRGNFPINSLGRGTIKNTNLAVVKSFALPGDVHSLEFQAEFQNLFNYALFERPGDVFPSDIFGKIVDTQNKGRAIQFMLKVNF